MIQARLQQDMNSEFADVQAGFRKGRGTRDQIANVHWIIEKVREFQENIYCFIDTKAFDCGSQQTVENSWGEERRIRDHLTCLLRNLYVVQEGTVGTRCRTTDWFQIGKGVKQDCILSPCLFSFYAEYIMQKAGLDEAQGGMKILGEISVTSVLQMTSP